MREGQASSGILFANCTGATSSTGLPSQLLLRTNFLQIASVGLFFAIVLSGIDFFFPIDESVIMKTLGMQLNAALLFSLLCPLCNAGEPVVTQCVADVSFSGKTLSFKNVADCGWGGEGSLGCPVVGACELHFLGKLIISGQFEFVPKNRAEIKTTVHQASGISIRPQADGTHLQFQCESPACTVSWKQNRQSEERHLTYQQTVIAPLRAQIRFNYLSD